MRCSEHAVTPSLAALLGVQRHCDFPSPVVSCASCGFTGASYGFTLAVPSRSSVFLLILSVLSQGDSPPSGPTVVGREDCDFHARGRALRGPVCATRRSRQGYGNCQGRPWGRWYGQPLATNTLQLCVHDTIPHVAFSTPSICHYSFCIARSSAICPQRCDILPH